MEPNIHEGQYVLVNKAIYAFQTPERGNTIVFRAPNGSGRDYIKRIIGRPGDIVEVRKGKVYINGSLIIEPYIDKPPVYTVHRKEVPSEFYFVLGDNRNNSNDSHNGWLVPRENIIGKAWLCLWPPGTWGFAPNYTISTDNNTVEPQVFLKYFALMRL